LIAGRHAATPVKRSGRHDHEETPSLRRPSSSLTPAGDRTTPGCPPARSAPRCPLARLQRGGVGLRRLGDIDSVARGRLARVIAIFGVGRQPTPRSVIVCRHVRTSLHLIALDPMSPTVLAMESTVARSSRFDAVHAEDLKALEVHDDGVPEAAPRCRRLMKWCTRRRRVATNWTASAPRTWSAARRDPEGVELGSHLFGPGAPLAQLVEAMLDGRWDARRRRGSSSGASSELAGAVRDRAQAAFQQAERTCPALRMVLDEERQMPLDRSAWLDSCAPTTSWSTPRPPDTTGGRRLGTAPQGTTAEERLGVPRSGPRPLGTGHSGASGAVRRAASLASDPALDVAEPTARTRGRAERRHEDSSP